MGRGNKINLGHGMDRSRMKSRNLSLFRSHSSNPIVWNDVWFPSNLAPCRFYLQVVYNSLSITHTHTHKHTHTHTHTIIVRPDLFCWSVGGCVGHWREWAQIFWVLPRWNLTSQTSKMKTALRKPSTRPSSRHDGFWQKQTQVDHSIPERSGNFSLLNVYLNSSWSRIWFISTNWSSFLRPEKCLEAISFGFMFKSAFSH